MRTPFQLRFQTEPGVFETHGFHLGTNLSVAERIASELYAGRMGRGLPTVSAEITDSDWTVVRTYDES